MGGQEYNRCGAFFGACMLTARYTRHTKNEHATHSMPSFGNVYGAQLSHCTITRGWLFENACSFCLAPHPSPSG